jgi:hypothetical protein
MKLDAVAAKDGIRTTVGLADDGRELVMWIRPATPGRNFDFEVYLAEAVEIIPQEPGESVMVYNHRLRCYVYAHACIPKWEGFEVDGEPAPCTPELVHGVLVECPDIVQAVKARAEAEGEYRLRADTKSD